MGRITTGTGLVSGLDIQGIVDQLIAIEKRPLTQLQTRIDTQKKQQAALTDIATQLASLASAAKSFTSSTVGTARSATTSNSSVLAATAQSGAVLGTYLVQPIRQAQSQQLLSQGFADTSTTPVGAGTITVKLGGYVNPDITLDQLNGGLGVKRGKVSITDRSGATAVVDLSTALSVNDVLNTINNATGIRVRASVVGDSFRLTDQTGSTTSNLIVQEVGAGTTASDLGLGGSVASNTHTGADVVKLGATLGLGNLNDQNGVRTLGAGNDLRITAKDGSTIDVGFAGAKSIQDILTAINSDSENSSKVTASIAAGGESLLLTDNTAGGGTLGVTALGGSLAAFDLGILGNEQGGGLLTGRRVLAGLNTVLLRDLNGGSGVATPGQVQLTDRSGATATIDLTNAATIDDVVSAINGAGLGLSATINSAGNGLVITDTTGQTASNLKIEDLGGATTAADLHIAADVVASSKASGDLNLRYISVNTQLDRLNGGAGIQRGFFKITDSSGGSGIVNLTTSTIRTLGDIITAINTSGADVTASINSTGDGILLTDTAGGAGQIVVSELGSTTAASLRLVGSAASQIDGAFRYQITVSATDTLTNVVTKLADSGAPITASLINDDSGATPFRLLFSAKQPGARGRMLIDTGATGLQVSTLSEAADAVVGIGGGAGGAPGLLFTSSTNLFQNVVPGVSLLLGGTSSTPITVTVGANTQPLIDAVGQLVDRFNVANQSLTDDTKFDPDAGTRAVLQGDATAREAQNSLLSVLTNFAGSGTNAIRSLGELGLTLEGGVLTIDSAVFAARLNDNPEAVQNFFGDATDGLGKKLSDMLERISNPFDGAITAQLNSLTDRLTDFNERMTFLNSRLDDKRTRLLSQFLAMEQALAKIQGQSSALTQLSNLAAQALTSSGNG